MTQHKPGAEVTDLGLIRVETVGAKDTVFLTHSNAKAFTLTCQEKRPSRIVVSKEFYKCEEGQWEEVFAVYLKWKRKHFPDFRLPNYSGKAKDGKHHPWSFPRPH